MFFCFVCKTSFLRKKANFIIENEKRKKNWCQNQEKYIKFLLLNSKSMIFQSNLLKKRKIIKIIYQASSSL